MIPILNIISLLILLIILFLLMLEFKRSHSRSLVALILAFCLLAFVTLTNLLEHMRVAPYLDRLEDILDVLFLPTLILSIYLNLLEKELHKRKLSERKFRVIFNNTFNYVGLLDKDGYVLDVNKATLRGAGLTIDQVRGIPFPQGNWWADEDRPKVQRAILQAQNGEIARFQSKHFDHNNAEHIIDFTLTPLYDSKSQEIIYLIPEGHDITLLSQVNAELERHKIHLEKRVEEKTYELNQALETAHQLNESLKARNDELQQQSDYLKNTLNHLEAMQDQLVESEKMASLGLLTAGVAHEINNPLNFIKGGLTNIASWFSSDREKPNDIEIRLSIDAIQEGIDRIVRIVNSLSSYSRTDNYAVSECSVNKVLDECLTILSSSYKHRIEIKRVYEDEVVIFANSGRIHQVFLNLINNAIQAIRDTGTITLSTTVKEQKVIVTIADDGSGIEEKDIKKIFDPFFTTKDTGEGTGLGLSISKRIIGDYKGSISYKSKRHEGTIVTVTFPAHNFT